MTPEARRTALVVVASEAEPVVDPFRRRFLPAAVERGIPAHLTVLFPFVPADHLDEDIVAMLEALYAPLVPFAYQLVSVMSFPGVAWLAPEPSEPFVDLIARTTAAFPNLPPYGGAHSEPVPHCTVGDAERPERLDEIVAELRAELAPGLPIRCRCAAVTLLEELADGTWSTNRSFRLTGSA